MVDDHEVKKLAQVTPDCLVVGGGLIGLATARSLAARGLSVVLIERDAELGAESSWAAAGMLAPQAEADSPDTFFRLACASRDLYPAWAASLQDETGVDVELDSTGTLYLALNEADEVELKRRYEWQHGARLAVERYDAEDVPLLEPRVSPQVRMALRFPLDAQIEPRRLLAALKISAVARGVRLLTGTEVTSLRIAHDGERVSGVETSCGPVGGGAVVIAAGAWSSFVKAPHHDYTAPAVVPVRGQMLCFAGRPPLVRHVVYSPRGYLVPRRDGRLLAGSTTERVGFQKHVTDEGVRVITAHAAEIVPAVGRLPLADSWAGLRPASEDRLPLLGASARLKNLYYATGHYRNGVLLAPLTARIIADLVAEGRTTDAALVNHFAPERFAAAGVEEDYFAR